MSVRLTAIIQCDVCGDEPDWKYPPEVQWDRFPLVDTSTAGEISAKALGMLTTKGWKVNVEPTVLVCSACRREGRTP